MYWRKDGNRKMKALCLLMARDERINKCEFCSAMNCRSEVIDGNETNFAKQEEITLKDRLLAGCVKTGECWVWNKSVASSGYGQIRLNYKNLRANRASYMVFKGEIPDGMVIRHTCDNKLCINPEHLILGSCKQNSQDMVERDRRGKGRAEWTLQVIQNLTCKRLRIQSFPIANWLNNLESVKAMLIELKMVSLGLF